MTTGSIITNPNYRPNDLLDWFMNKFSLKNDAALARDLDVDPPVISKIRRRKIPIGDTMLVRMHYRLDGIHIRELRKMMGVE